MDLVSLMSNDIILRTLTPYLPLSALGNLARTCSSLNDILLCRPGAIHELDLAFYSTKTVAKVLEMPVVRSSLRVLFLDSCFVDNEGLKSLFIEYKLRHLSLCASYGWSLECLTDLIEKYYLISVSVSVELSPSSSLSSSYATSVFSGHSGYSTPTTEDDRPSRPSIKSLGLLGGPMFPTTSLSATAPVFVELATKAGIVTDLTQCQAHFPAPSPAGWFLAEPNARTCHTCGRADENLCLRCLVLRSCRGCQKFWCSKCDPTVSRTRLDCYDCGPTCETCKLGVANFCKFCKAKYCRVHQEGSTDEYCDWCSSRGGRSRHLY
ncbi:hypothetical protein V1512DRAFT_205174 [Lipomyces arxii]|uniref:uncharacterized protein n=1 Tax=Lipomyces arxii TaxID=56418 RepID=UPI0034CE0C87